MPDGTPMHRTILGLDPSTVGYGIAVVEFPEMSLRPVVRFYHVIRPYSDVRSIRLATIAVDLERLFDVKHPPAVAAFEGGFVGPGAQTSLAIAEARGVGMAVCGRLEIEVVQVSPSSGKIAATGKGNAQKGEVIEWVAALCDLPDGIDFLPEDASDAAAIALSAGVARGWWKRPVTGTTKIRRRKRATSTDEFLRLAIGGLQQ